MYITSHLAVLQKLTPHCKSAITENCFPWGSVSRCVPTTIELRNTSTDQAQVDPWKGIINCFLWTPVWSLNRATGVNSQDGQMLWGDGDEGSRKELSVLKREVGKPPWGVFEDVSSWQHVLWPQNVSGCCFQAPALPSCLPPARLFFPSWCQKCKSGYSRNNRSVSPNAACYHPSSQHLLVALTTWRWNRMWTKVETKIPDFFSHVSW